MVSYEVLAAMIISFQKAYDEVIEIMEHFKIPTKLIEARGELSADFIVKSELKKP